MSEFFNITLNKDIVLDDSVTNSNSGWSGEKVLKEINKHRITKFEELADVDVINKEDKQVVIYSGDTNKFTTINLDNMGEAAGISLRQISKMGVKGSQSAPQIINIPISTVDFKVPRINVLKFQEGSQNVIKNINSFSNGECDDFQYEDMIELDGAAYLKSKYNAEMNYEGEIEGFKCYSAQVDKSKFKIINSFEIISHNLIYTLKISGNPNNKLLTSIRDINLSNAKNIHYFNIVGTNDIKIVCSVDGGTTWKTFRNNSWVDINLDIKDIEVEGINVTNFNSINSIYWSSLITSDKIRFAYLLTENNLIDEIKLQYDEKGYWIEVKDDDYEVIYSSNSLMQVRLYFNGDIKINY